MVIHEDDKIVVVRLYHRFLTTFSIGLYYLFLPQAWVMEEGTKKEVSAITDFIMSNSCISIYYASTINYAPLYLAVGRPTQ